MLLIQTIFGSDTKILTEDEITEGYFTKEYLKAREEIEFPSWDVEFRNELHGIDKDIVRKALELPQRCRTGRQGTIFGNGNKAIDGYLIEDLDEKGVLLFSKKGDSYRFSFTDISGKSALFSAQMGLSSFKAKEDEKPCEVTEGFYDMYNRARNKSGMDIEKSTRSKNVQELDQKVLYLVNEVKWLNQKSENLEYLNRLRTILNDLDSLPLYYIHSLLDISLSDSEFALNEFKNIVNEDYLDTILEKDHQIVNEPETILLSEQFI
jgi:hypothetical protein